MSIHLFLFPLILNSVWIEKTNTVNSPRAMIENKSYIQFSPETFLEIKYSRKTSTRWFIRCEHETVLRIWKENNEYKKIKLKKGINKVKIFFEPGKYRFSTTKPALARYYVWKRRKWKSLVPQGGGYPIILFNKDKKYVYYMISPDTSVTVKVKGPKTLYIFLRARLKKGQNKSRVEVSILEGEKILAHSVKTLRKSKKYFFAPDSLPASKPLRFTIKVPKGLHTLTIKCKRGRGAVKIYRSLKKKRKKKKRTYKKLQGFNISHRSLELAFIYSDNPYRYSEGFIDTFSLGTYTYRYPGVMSIYDYGLNIKARVSLRVLNNFYPMFTLKINYFFNNTQQNWIYYALGLQFKKQPVAIYLSYSKIPGKPVRPTYVSPFQYELMEFNYTGITGKFQFNLSNVRLFLSGKYSIYDYTPVFDTLDADSKRLALGIGLKPARWVFEFSLGTGKINQSLKGINSDWSNKSLFYRLKIKPFTKVVEPEFTLKYTVRDFTTQDTLDVLHYSRVDRETHFTSKVGFTVIKKKLFVRYDLNMRKTYSIFPRTDRIKDYIQNNLSVGIYLGV